MKIQYLGHSSFLLEESTGTTIITDPFDGIGYDMPLRRADIVTVSHGHHDHDSIKSVDGNPLVIEEEGTHKELLSKGGIYADLYKLYSTD